MRGSGAFAFGQIGRGVGGVHFQPFDQRAKGHHELPFAGGGHRGLAVGRDLGVPGIVELAGFHHGAGRAFGIAAALDHRRRKGRFRRVAVVGVGGEGHRVIDGKAGDGERPGADRHVVRVGAGRGGGPGAGRELRLLQEGRQRADKGGVGVRLGRGEGHLDGGGINSLDRGDAFILGRLRAAAGRVHAIGGGEHGVIGGDGGAIAPQQARNDLPGD